MCAVSKYFLYKTTNIINGKFYIGVHKDNGKPYYGSGKRLKESIKKYGKESFIYENIKEFDNAEDAFNYEKQIVTQDLVENRQCYNVVCGGLGGFPVSDDHKRKISENNKKRFKTKEDHPRYGAKLSQETRKKISDGNKGKILPQSMRDKTGARTKGNKFRSIPVYIEGIIYQDKVEAAKKLNVGIRTIHRWCDINDKYHKNNCFTIRG
jgi:hypothetical protein